MNPHIFPGHICSRALQLLVELPTGTAHWLRLLPLPQGLCTASHQDSEGLHCDLLMGWKEELDPLEIKARAGI